MKEYDYHVVNVFSERGIRGGNPLGVIFNAKNLKSDDMQWIAKQFNYSESTFIIKETDNDANVRIFLPTQEIDFAGSRLICSS